MIYAFHLFAFFIVFIYYLLVGKVGRVYETEVYMYTAEVRLYSFNELSDPAKETAIAEHGGFITSACDEEETLSEKEIIDLILVNEYLFFRDGSLAHTVRYTGKHEKAGTIEFKFHGDVYPIAPSDVHTITSREGARDVIVTVVDKIRGTHAKAFAIKEKETMLSFLRNKVKQICADYDGTDPKVIDAYKESDLYEYIDEYNANSQSGVTIKVVYI